MEVNQFKKRPCTIMPLVMVAKFFLGMSGCSAQLEVSGAISSLIHYPHWSLLALESLNLAHLELDVLDSDACC